MRIDPPSSGNYVNHAAHLLVRRIPLQGQRDAVSNSESAKETHQSALRHVGCRGHIANKLHPSPMLYKPPRTNFEPPLSQNGYGQVQARGGLAATKVSLETRKARRRSVVASKEAGFMNATGMHVGCPRDLWKPHFSWVGFMTGKTKIILLKGSQSTGIPRATLSKSVLLGF